MRIASCFVYVLCTIIYSGYGESSVGWYGFGQITILLFICLLGIFTLDKRPNTYSEKLFLEYSVAITGVRALYTLFCIFNEAGIVLYNTDLFSFIIRTTFLIVLLNCLIKTNQPLK